MWSSKKISPARWNTTPGKELRLRSRAASSARLEASREGAAVTAPVTPGSHPAIDATDGLADAIGD
jgi:hypothetical protein